MNKEILKTLNEKVFLNPQSNGLSEALVYVDRVPTKDCVI